MKLYYSWRYSREMPYLDEAEWQEISPLLTNAVQAIMDYRKEHGCDVATARIKCKPVATKRFQELTGVSNVHFEQIFHLRRSNFGIECEECGHLLRTPRASFCADCGWVPE